VGLIRALGGGWIDPATADAAPATGAKAQVAAR
jgi:hypothetical protein